jgi:hypothetical protein
VVLFSKDSRNLGGSFTFEIPKSAAKKVRVLITDLAEGKWKISCGKKVFLTSEVNAQSGTLYFEAGPGKYTVSR